ncbi:hypothetical protein [Helicobacter pylori]|uniref:hypothetical protein n=1 Tax=Helicobacter pylori TaxID=210 RepID=UPI001E30E93E|nr:hypothetical protein [Helicobacter pylori]
MSKISSYQKLKAQNIALKAELNAKDQIIESQKETIGALKRETDIKDQLINSSTEERHRDEEKEHSRSCLGLE